MLTLASPWGRLVGWLLGLLLPAVAWAQVTDGNDEAGLGGPLPEETESAQPTPFGPRYVIEDVVVRGNRKTETWLVLRELGLRAGDVITGAGPWRDAARLRLLSLGYFLDVSFSLGKGARHGQVVLVVDVEERGTIVINALHLGTSEATAFWGGVDVAETNFLGRGIALAAGFVQSTRPRVPGAEPGFALSLRAAGPPPRPLGLGLSGSLLYSDGSELFRATGADDDPRPSQFVAVQTRRAGGGLAVGTELSRATRVFVEGRYESIDTRLPDVRTRTDGAASQPISFGIHEGASRLGSVAVTLDVDTRSDPVLPTRGGRAAVTLQAALPVVGSSYAFAKGVAQASRYWPAFARHVLGFHALAGAVFGDAPYFERFFVGDLNLLLPPRALGLNFSTLPSRDFLGTSIAAHRYESFAARALVEYAVPLWRRRGFAYRADAFVALGAFALASGEDLRVRDTGIGRAIPVDLTADLGLRLDTQIGIFTLSIANALGRIPF